MCVFVAEDASVYSSPWMDPIFGPDTFPPCTGKYKTIKKMTASFYAESWLDDVLLQNPDRWPLSFPTRVSRFFVPVFDLRRWEKAFQAQYRERIMMIVVFLRLSSSAGIRNELA